MFSVFLYEYEVVVSLRQGVRVVVPVALELGSHVDGMSIGFRKAERVAWDVLGLERLADVSLADLCEGYFVEVNLLGVRGGVIENVSQ